MKIRSLFNMTGAALALSASVLGFESGAAFAAYTPPAQIPTCTAGGPTPCTDYFGVANYANSPLPAGQVASITLTAAGSGYTGTPTVTITDAIGSGTGATATATVSGGIVTGILLSTAGSNYIAPQVTITGGGGTGATADATIGGALTGGMRKFVDALPGICTTAPSATVQQCIPVAVPDTTTFTGNDYYVIGLQDTSLQMHTDLPATKIRGYVQLNAPGTPAAVQQYLGPLIIAQKDRPVRLTFQNLLPTGNAGDLFQPIDTTYMGAGMGPDGMSYYTQNRATIHLHGGRTPWISDGTPHQWITPANDTNATYQKGVSFQNVPDMIGAGKPIPTPAANDGKATFFYTNQQSGRLLFYHDHAYGTTRQNVYAGEAAGYLIVDPAMEAALATGTAPGTIQTPGTLSATNNDLTHLIPLVIQDKTFVPQPQQLSATDPTWNSTAYGGYGNLWFPHVYMTNQDPADPLNMNAFGRWDYGPWFFPPQNTLTAGPLTIPCTSAAHPGVTVQCPIIPNPSGTPESFMDTPVVNGKAYPVLHVAPAAYRFHMLSVGNDRTFNLSWFVADIAQGNTEVKLLPAIPPAGISVCTQATAITNPGINGLAVGALDSTGMPLNGTGLPANCWPTTWPLLAGTGGTAGLTGVVPDPAAAGPAWIQIGTEGGPLPGPVVIPPTPALYETNPKSITVGSVASHGLLLGPAERADVIVDFSKFAGKTLILYNDGPTPIPGYDIRYDYYTGDADNTATGGAPPTKQGYGPNTRTIMQVIVDQTAPNATVFSLNSLKQAFASTGATSGIFKALQDPPVVPESTYNSAYNQTFTDTFMKLQDDYMSYLNFDGTVPAVTVTAGGSGYTAVPTVTFGAGCATAPVATATISGGAVTGITLTSAGVGCTSIPTVTIGGPGTGATAIVGRYIERKTIQELFTLDYGRMNATLGTELPLTNFLTQTTIPLGYIDPPTEIFKEGETQLWRVTHNGVDTHLIHFHLFDVQIINRVGWDGTVRPPDPNEIGWKDTVRMNPLEDIIVALRPVKMTFPFQIPDSVRNMDVTMPTGTSAQFTGVDPFTNLPMTTVNQPVNFGWEYVWHCHILGHEENDMMRPMVFEIAPEAPTGLTAALKTTAPTGITLNWTNNANSATSFTIQRATNAAFTTGLTTLTMGTATMDAAPLPLGATAFNDTTVAPGTTYYYRIAATKTFPARQSPVWTVPPQTENISSAWVGAATVTSAGVSLTPNRPSPTTVGTSVVFTAVAGGTGSFQYQFWLKAPGGAWTVVQNYSTTSTWTWNTTGLATGTYNVSVYVRHVGSTAAYEAFKSISYVLSTPATGATLSPSPASPSLTGTPVTFSATGSGGSGTYAYQFWLKAPGGAWSVVQDYSPTATWNWNTTGLAGGTYNASVYVRNLGSTAAYEAFKSVSYALTVPPATAVTLTPNPISPSTVGTPVLLTAAASGGTGTYQYQFWLKAPGGAWTMVQNYSTTATYNWNTTGRAAGIYTVSVYARSNGNTAAYEATKIISYQLN